MIITAMLVQSIAVPVPAQAQNEAWDGSTTSEVQGSDNTYTITTAAELAWVAQQVNKESGNNTFSGKTVKLANDIDLNGKDWIPIGSSSTNTFAGTFDGNGYVISNMKVASAIEESNDAYAGLFGNVSSNNSYIQNLAVKGEINITTEKTLKAGGIAGSTTGYIDNCYTDVKITVNNTSTSTSSCHIGGIVGFATTQIPVVCNCYSLGDVTFTGVSSYVGGIAGQGNLQYCYTTGAVTVKNTRTCYVGGLSGNGKINNCIALNKSITGTGETLYIQRIGSLYSSAPLSSNYASPLIPGTWSNPGADKKDGAPLTKANFLTSPSETDGAFNGWGDSWDFTTNATNLPTLKTNGSNSTAIAGQGTMPTRASFLPPSEITNEATLKTFRDAVNYGYSYEGETVKLTADIALAAPTNEADGNWTPIGISTPFKGTFDGNGYTISNMKVTETVMNNSNAYAGLFGNAYGSTIQNLGVTGSIKVSSDKNPAVGGIAGWANVNNCYTDVSIEVTGTSNKSCEVGGITGQTNSTTHCYAKGDIAIKGSFNSIHVGGISGSSPSYCYATGAIHVERNATSTYIGGIGGNYSGVQHCIALNRNITYEGTGNLFLRRVAATNNDAFADGNLFSNYASPAIPGDWSDEEADKPNGALLTYANFVTNPTSEKGDTVFNDWGGSWDFGDKSNLPILKRKTGEGTYDTWPSSITQSTPTRASVMRVLSIADHPQLKAFAKTVNNNDSYENATVKLTADITIPAPTSPETSNWTPIGDTREGFNGTFDGQGHCISGIEMNKSGEINKAGLFGSIATGVVMNLGLKESHFRIHSTTTSGDSYIGGIAGYSFGTIKNCYTDVTVEASGGNLCYAGGITGKNNKTITNCYTLGDVTSSDIAGGIAGIIGGPSSNLVNYCYATGKIEGKLACGIGYTQVDNTQINHCLALNTNGIIGSATDGTTARIASAAGSSTNTLANNYASPLIRGSWSHIGANAADGADLTEANFTGNSTTTTGGAFDGWTTSDTTAAPCWDFSDNTRLPKLKTTGLTENIAIAGQGDADGNMPKRQDFLIRTITISTPTDYKAEEHDKANINITSTGTLTIDADGVTIPLLDIEDGGQVVAKKGFTCTKLEARRPLVNKWIAYGYSQEMFMTNNICKLYAMTGYADADHQYWETPTEQGTEGGIPQAANTPTLLAAEEGNHENFVTFRSNSPLTIPADAAPTEGASLATGQFLFCVNPTLKNVTLTSPAYLLNADGTRFERTEPATVKPFQAYMVANAITTNSIRSLAIGNGIPTANGQPALPDASLRLWADSGTLYLSADTPTKVSLYNATGQLIRRLSLTGQQTVALSPGIYFVRCNNITYKIIL